MCNAVVAAVEKDQQIKAFMGDDIKAWSEFVAGPLNNENERQQTVIGGHRPTSPFRQQGEEGDQLAGGFDQSGNAPNTGFEDNNQYGFDTSNVNQDDDEDEGDGLGYPNGAGAEFGAPSLPADEEGDEDWANNVPVQFSSEWPSFDNQNAGTNSANQSGTAAAGTDAKDGSNTTGAQTTGNSAESGKKDDANIEDSDSDTEDEFDPRSAHPGTDNKAQTEQTPSQSGSNDGKQAANTNSPAKSATSNEQQTPQLPADVTA
jgi:hypothetical protein